MGFGYLYDFGDNRQHTIEVEKINRLGRETIVVTISEVQRIAVIKSFGLRHLSIREDNPAERVELVQFHPIKHLEIR